MNFELYQRVALKRDLPANQLKKDDVAILIDFVPHPSSGEDGCVLEVFNATGESIAVVIVPKSDIKSLTKDEVLSVRSLVEI
ncbi:DUF4926 domain-containing protein [Rivularia sp. UHCC 0363]|uniref:DUF4926 domain-containing protein n=1 Tax=Rivularia sp. UHCC 0363 TaxID=3110244 RepID=UPI002B21B185|nr:DUF4926 domain-containing protein [Rivularia sp. UHCC 0363]MEA5593828.1 DUF4926 domain-containing protein [Rivularia sp. UHCC 0363]